MFMATGPGQKRNFDVAEQSHSTNMVNFAFP
jgi:hypothetical protein